MIKKILEFIARLQCMYPKMGFSIILIFTIIMSIGVGNLQVQSDFSKENPRQLPAFVLTDRISDEFGGENTVILLFEVEEYDENNLIDLRNAEFVDFTKKLSQTLVQDSRVIATSSIGSIAKGVDLKSDEDVLAFLKNVPATDSLFSKDYRMTILTITTSIGGAYEDVVPFQQMIEEKIKSVGVPGGVKYTLTGFPPFGKVIRETVFSDALKTISIAALGILLLLVLTEKSFTKAFIIFIPLIFALIWTGGALGFSGMKLSIASVALGSIILGLGVEYGVFMLTRYNEERFINQKNQITANSITVSSIGLALLGSGTTTIAGFLALTFSITPMMQVLGISLATGIFFCILSAILVTPLLIILHEDYEKYSLNQTIDEKNAKHAYLNRR